MDEKGLGRRLQAVRQAAGFTQQQLCHQAGLSYSTLTKIERGAIKAPSIFTIQHIAIALEVGLDELMGMKATRLPRRQAVSKNGIRFVYFDINGCLVRFFQQAFTKLSLETGASADTVEAGFWHYNDEVCRGRMSMADFNAAYAKRLGIRALDWKSYYLDAVEPIPAMHELVAWVAGQYQVGLLTNIMPGFITAMQARGLLPDITYDAIIDSSAIGSIKPEAGIYEAAAKQTGLATHEILLIDDERPNLMAAEHKGWRVLLLDDYRLDESIARIRDALAPLA